MIKLFWHIICAFYSSFILSGIKLTPPKYLFNQPKSKPQYQVVEEIRADRTFTYEERKEILEAAHIIEKFTNNWIKIEICFNLNPLDYHTIQSQSVMLRATEEDPDVRTWDHKTNSKILGLCLHKSNYTANLYILANRIINKHIFRITVIHELGHFLGMGHTDRISVMHKFNYGTILYPTYIDALEFGKIYNCEPDQLCYFKL